MLKLKISWHHIFAVPEIFLSKNFLERMLNRLLFLLSLYIFRSVYTAIREPSINEVAYYAGALL